MFDYLYSLSKACDGDILKSVQLEKRSRRPNRAYI